MTRLSSIATTYRPPKTSSELRAVLQNDLTPCQKCGSAIFSVLHSGEIACLSCDYDLATGPQCAIPIIVVLADDGRGGKRSIARDLREVRREIAEERRIDQAEYWLDRPGGRVRVIPIRERRPLDCPRDMTVDEWFEGLPEPDDVEVKK